MKRLLVAFILCLSLGAFAAPAVAQLRTTPTDLIQGELHFPRSDGWSKPALTRSKDGFLCQLWFRSAPLDPVSALARVMDPVKRRAITRVEAFQVPGQTVVQVHFRSPVKGLFVKKGYRPRGWRLVANLDYPNEIVPVSYANRKQIPVFPLRLMLGAVESEMREKGFAKCESLDFVASAKSGWPGWIALKYGDCLRMQGRQEEAADVMRRLVRQRKMPRPVVVLAALRLDEWPETYNPWIRLAISNKDMRRLPRSVLQELNLRQARRMVRMGRLKSAVNSFLVALRKSGFPSTLDWVAQEVRLELLDKALEEGQNDWVVRLFQAMPVPPTDHPAYLPTLRNGALGYVRLGYMDQAIALSNQVLEPKGSVVDPELTTAIVQALRQLGKSIDVKTLAPAVPTELDWLTAAADSTAMSPAVSLLLAQWLLDIWDDVGAFVASDMVRNAGVVDQGQAFSESRMAVLLGARECAEILKSAPGTLPTDRIAFASLCKLATGPAIEALDAWNPDKVNPFEDGGSLGWAVQNHVRDSTDFYDDLDDVLQELGRRTPEERERLKAQVLDMGNVAVPSDLGDGVTSFDPLAGEVPKPDQLIDSAFHYEMASTALIEAANELKGSGKLEQDDALRAAVRKHAEASARLLEELESKKEGE